MEQPTHPDLLAAQAIYQLRILNELLGQFRDPHDDGFYPAGDLGFFNICEEYVRTRALLQQIDREIFDDDTDPGVIQYMNDYHDRLQVKYSRANA